ncbi:glutamyl-tRNA reductase [Candidatus Venteria ishoeyi]|uniref:Glutamyl-tRNA reductase n=1 Tax=Candidatus Venteria ishoeyi TaxID=1899563 RepID=A0A1H6FCF1_9GAMM|nr:glutamyl-tRNA reductase [Candidatus Venteria ishoeyi]MDM8544980.1 glutamyl-tRNA reductase [Candidatus Venteria ishoeyi]SEH07762.1 Glutamyl-tRNA reductase [Candidatus Venteria ishoeyi]
MRLFAFGINHNTATVDIRERFSFTETQLPVALQDLKQQTGIREAVLLSTCNRTEVYCGIQEDGSQVIDWFSQYRNTSRDLLNTSLYVHSARSAVRHLLRVASGLDSMVLGEPQILGQLKNAYRIAQKSGTLGMLLGRLFQHSFAVAKQVRTDTAISSSPISVAFAAVRLAQQVFGDLSNRTALLIGAGETIELAARHLHENQLGRMVVANRTLERARHLAMAMGGYAITLPEISEHLAEADVIISSTGSDIPVLLASQIQEAVKKRKHRPMFIVDIAVPRDVEAAAGDLENVYLYTVDDLNDVIQENLRNRQQAAVQAEEIIDTQVTHFISWLDSLGAVDTICAIREQALQQRQEVSDRALRLLKNGGDPEDVIQQLAYQLTNTFLHAPSTQLREAASNGDEEFIDVARQLFNLPEIPPQCTRSETVTKPS